MMRKRKNKQDYNAMLVPFLSVSYFHYDDFVSYMKISSKVSSSGTSCGSGSSCSSCSSCSSSAALAQAVAGEEIELEREAGE
ncbi:MULTISPECIES: hypothetical protein [Cytobacillus]|uniref:hypothetical protein n=1 Tax=Cytobacillus TaxID=2675230 RepID=UPI00204150B9|nr:hypothetical protein [Cytobacillus firmus]MCM3706820.1 hypothetical protein [Cytobacillus firmus]